MKYYDENGQMRELTYIDMCELLNEEVNNNPLIPQSVKDDARETIASVVDILWGYSN